MRTRLGLFLALAFGLLLAGVPAAMAQTSGTISGTVSDPTGAVVPGATVTIKNEATGLTRVVQANSAGFYTAPDLPVGSYSISVTATGFKTGSHTNIDLHVSEQKLVPVVLQVGTVTQTVEVTGGATQVELRSGTAASLIGPTQMSQLPLNGRNFLQLALLVPGASPADTINTTNTGLLSGSDVSMSGSSANANAWLVDGANNVDEGSGRTLLIYPSVDSIEEFKVQRNAMGAENPGAGGAVISVVTKSGSNSFHGSAYDFVRNTIFDGNNFFLNKAGQPRPKRRYNDFGFSVGGPIKKDKLFFFESEEWRRDIRGIARMATVPTMLERQGNFTPTARIGCSGGAAACLTNNYSVPTDPYTGAAFPDNTIPACASGQTTDCLSPAGLAILNLYPQPTNNDTTFNWVQGVTSFIGTREDSVRIDYNHSARTTLSGRYTNDQWYNPAPNAGSENGLWGDDGFPTVDSAWSQPSKSIAGHLTQTFSASVVNDIAFTYSNNRIFITQGLGKNINDAINAAIPGVFPHPGEYSHAIFWGAPPGSASLWNEAPWQNGEDLFTWKDDFTKTSGNSTYKFGGLYNYNRKNEPIFGNSGVSPQFWGPTAIPGGAGKGGGWGPSTAPGNGGQVTGNGLADLLLQGTYWGESGEQSLEPNSYIRWKDLELYGADTWRVSPRLTLDLGVRYEFLPPTYQADDHIGSFIPSLYNPALATGDSAATDGLIFAPGYVNPAFGIKGGSSNLRGINVGRSLRRTTYDAIAPRFGFAWDPTGKAVWAIRGGGGVFYGRGDNSNPDDSLEGNPPFSAQANCGNGRPLDSLGPSSLCSVGLGTPTYGADINWKVQGSYQWNFTVERQFAQNTKMEVTYVGNRGVHLPIRFNLNQTPLADFAQYQTRALTPNFCSSIGLGSGCQDFLRPLYPLKGTGTLDYQTQGGNSIYNALQVYVTKRFSRGYSFGISYSYGQTLADTSQTCCQGTVLSINEDPKYDRGLSNFDRTHILSVNYIYDTPALNGQNRLVRGVFGNWESTGVFTYDSGLPLFVTGGVASCPVNACRPNILGYVQPHTPDQWFAANDYGSPTQIGELGSSSIANLRGPGINNFDIAIFKNVPLHWENTSLQFRVETFNTLNHTQLLSVQTGYTSISQTLVNGKIACIQNGVDQAPFCNNNGTFGKPVNARDAREIQFALKFLF